MRARRWLTLSIAAILIALSGLVLAVDGPLTNALNLRVRTDANGYLLAANGTYSGADGPLTNFGNIRLRTDGNGYLLTTLSNTSPALFSDGTSGAPSIAFASEPTLGFWRSASGVVTLQGGLNLAIGSALNASGDVQAAATRFITWSARASMGSPSNGNVAITLSNGSIGSQLKVDALPTVSACGAGSPAVIAGSTPLSGAVTIGTTAVATCTITFNGTAFPSAPHCSGSVETTTAANSRAMGYSATTTVLTIVPTAAWADSSVVNWTCLSSK